MYHDKGMSLREIGNEVGVHGSTIKRWMDKKGIPTRPSPQEKPPQHILEHPTGYEQIRHYGKDKKSGVYIHQLIVIANGADPEKVFSSGQYHVHHKSGHPLDNRPENLELLTREEHNAIHGR